MRAYLLIFGSSTIPLVTDVPYGNIVVVVMAGVGAILLKRTVDKLMEKVDSIPPKEWFEEVRDALKKIPDPVRLHEYYTQGNDQASTLSLHVGQIAELQRRMGEVEHRLNGFK